MNAPPARFLRRPPAWTTPPRADKLRRQKLDPTDSYRSYPVPTSTPPPYFPQNSLLPPDPNRWKKIRLALFGCLAVAVLLVVGFAFGLYKFFQ